MQHDLAQILAWTFGAAVAGQAIQSLESRGSLCSALQKLLLLYPHTPAAPTAASRMANFKQTVAIGLGAASIGTALLCYGCWSSCVLRAMKLGAAHTKVHVAKLDEGRQESMQLEDIEEQLEASCPTLASISNAESDGVSDATYVDCDGRTPAQRTTRQNAALDMAALTDIYGPYDDYLDCALSKTGVLRCEESLCTPASPQSPQTKVHLCLHGQPTATCRRCTGQLTQRLS